MGLLAFKLILPPLLILVASLAGRRWGDVIGGWLVGLPLTSGPIAAFLAVQYGPEFAATATNGSLVGAAAQASFCLAYALLAEKGWELSLAAGAMAYAASGFLLQSLPLPHWGFLIVALLALILASRWIPHRATVRSGIRAPWWDLPARMAIATMLVLTLTWIASFVGARTAGVLASFPVFGATLTIFAHRMQSAAMARQVLRGMVLALYGFAAFFFVLGICLTTIGTASAFLAATISTLLVQTAALRVIRRAEAA